MRSHYLVSILLVLACGVTGGLALAQDITLNNRDVRGELVPAGAPAVLLPFVADPAPAGGDVFDTMCSDPAAIDNLIWPNGTEVDVTNAEALGFFYTVIQDGSLTATLFAPFSTRGTHTIISLPPSSTAGTYQIKINATAVADEAVALTTYFSSSSIKSALAIAPSNYRACDSVIVTGILLDGPAAITQANVKVDIADLANM